MSNGEVNCELEICCDLANAKKEFAKALKRDTGLSKEYAEQCAEFVYEHFDLAERGTLEPLKASIARLARGPAGGVKE